MVGTAVLKFKIWQFEAIFMCKYLCASKTWTTVTMGRFAAAIEGVWLSLIDSSRVLGHSWGVLLSHRVGLGVVPHKAVRVECSWVAVVSYAAASHVSLGLSEICYGTVGQCLIGVPQYPPRLPSK